MLRDGGRVPNGYRHEIGSVSLASSCLTLSLAQLFAVITHHKSAQIFQQSSPSALDPKLLSADPNDPEDDLWLDKKHGWLADLKKQWPRFLQEIIDPLRRLYPFFAQSHIDQTIA